MKRRGHRWIAVRPGEFFTWSELTTTNYPHLQSMPDRFAQRRLIRLCENTLDPLRRRIGEPLWLSSGWRSLDLNTHIGGAKGSRHTKGMAADGSSEGRTSFELATEIIEGGIPFDKLIAYEPEVGGHIHVSFVSTAQNRGQVLRCFRNSAGKKSYEWWKP